MTNRKEQLRIAQQRARDKKRAEGLVKLEFWVPHDIVKAVRDAVERLLLR